MQVSSPKKRNVGEKKIGRVLLAIIAIGAVIGLSQFAAGFYVNFRNGTPGILDQLISKSRAFDLAQNFLINNQAPGFNLNGYKKTASFYSDPKGTAFLEKSLGDREAKVYFRKYGLSEVRYELRFFRELQEEEYKVYVDAGNGKIAGFLHTVPSGGGQGNLAKSQAREAAFDFLERMRSLSGLEEKDYSVKKIENRTDHHFVFKLNGSDIDSEYGPGFLQLEVDVSGDEIGGFKDLYVAVPDGFTKFVDEQTSAGNFLTLLSLLATRLLYLLAFITLIAKLADRSADWKFFLGLSAAVFAIYAASLVNSFPVIEHAYPTSGPFAVFLGAVIIVEIIALTGAVAGMFVSGTAGEALARETWPGRIPVLSRLSRGDFFPDGLGMAVVWGYLISFLMLAVSSTLYYIGGRFFSVWTMPGVSGYSVFLYYFPPLGALILALVAAVNEEFFYRLFGITFFKKYGRSTALAIFIPTLIWAVAHSNYPVFPFYFRAIEVLISGLAFGYFFVKFNFETVFFAHYTFNAMLAGSVFLASGNVLYAVSAFLIILLPAVWALAGIAKKKKADFPPNNESPSRPSREASSCCRPCRGAADKKSRRSGIKRTG